MKIAGALFAPREDNKDENKAEVAKIFAEAEDVGARLLIFPEMTLSGFTMNHALYDPSDMEFFEKLAEKYGIAVLFGSIFKQGSNFFNSAVFYDPKSLKKAIYFKRRLFSYAKEDDFYSRGNKPVQFSFQRLKCSIVICYDLRFPELFRETKGSELFFVIASWPKSRKLHWDTLLRARAIENQAFVVGVNRIGFDADGTDYGQLSTAFDYFGKRLPSIKTHQLSIWEVSRKMVEKMKHWRETFPVLKE